MLIHQEGRKSCSIRIFDATPITFGSLFLFSFRFFLALVSRSAAGARGDSIFQLASHYCISDRHYEKRRRAHCQVLIEVSKETNKHKQIFKHERWQQWGIIKQLVSLAKAGYEALRTWWKPGETGFELGSLFSCQGWGKQSRKSSQVG